MERRIELDEFIGRKVITEVTATQDGNGWWKVEHRILQSRSRDGIDWDNREAVAEAVAKTIEDAERDCIYTMMAYLDSIKGDLFSDPDTAEEDKGLLN